MSTTFTIEGNPTGQFVLSPSCHDTIGGTAVFAGADDTTGAGQPCYSSYEQALLDLVAHKSGCDDCAHYGCYTQAVFDVPETGVNLSDANARTLIGYLGLDTDDMCGTVTVESFVERVTLFRATLDTEVGVSDTGISTYATQIPGQATHIDCGVEPGYYERVTDRLLDLANEAARLGRDLTWS